MRRTYSRLASVEERKNVKRAIYYILLAIFGLLALFFVGIPLLGRFAAFVSDIGKSNKPISVSDQTPPAPPKFSTFNDFTNQQAVSLSGFAESGATVKLTFNGNEENTLADKDGNFTFNLALRDGENSFSAMTVDTAGNESQKTQEYKITFDNKPPDLNIDSPADGAQFFGSGQRQVTIAGTTEVRAQVTINDRIVTVDDNGKFQYTTTLNEGSTPFNIKSHDAAGNLTEKNLTLNFSP
jgi:hypothetical protein